MADKKVKTRETDRMELEVRHGLASEYFATNDFITKARKLNSHEIHGLLGEKYFTYFRWQEALSLASWAGSGRQHCPYLVHDAGAEEP
jgi:hypothetical protein